MVCSDQGSTATVLTNVQSRSWTDTEFAVAILYGYFTDQNGFNGIDPTWNAAPSTDYGQNHDLQAVFNVAAREPIPP